MASSIEVKEIRRREHLHDLLHMAHMFHEEIAPHLDFEDQCIIDNYIRISNDFEREQYTAFVAYMNNTPVGFTVCQCNPYFFSKQKLAQLELWYVVPSLRNGRVSFALIQAFEEWARLRGAVELVTGVMVQDQPETVERTSRLLTKMGYPMVGHFHTRALTKVHTNARELRRRDQESIGDERERSSMEGRSERNGREGKLRSVQEKDATRRVS